MAMNFRSNEDIIGPANPHIHVEVAADAVKRIHHQKDQNCFGLIPHEANRQHNRDALNEDRIQRMEGTVRALDAQYRSFAETRLRAIAEGTAAALGATVEINWTPGYPVTVNTPEHTEFAAEVARSISGNVDNDVDPIMPAEDFSYMLEERPGAYIFLGNGDSAMCHHPRYNFNDEAIPFGSSWYSGMIEARIKFAT